MANENGKRVKSAGPSTPVEIMGLTEVPEAGDIFYEVKDEKTAKHLIEKRKREAREHSINNGTKVTLDNLFFVCHVFCCLIWSNIECYYYCI